MSYKALYRKYRPSNFEEVVGQEHIVETLKNIIKNDKVGHAYLFNGPKGTGKTSVAKIFASVLNCAHRNDSLNPCKECKDNLANNFDIIEMDAASNNGVDEIRDLKEKIEQAPINSKYKIYIVDEVHMLSKSAFNALLKTLEEPPKHAIFIFATTDPQKIPLTILSRLQRFNFLRMTNQNIVSHLQKIFKLENIQYEEKALSAIANLSSGGMRDALSVSDQLAALGNGKVTYKDVLKTFGIISSSTIIELLQIIAGGDSFELIKKLNQLYVEGIDPQQLIFSLINATKEWIIFNKTREEKYLQHFSKEDFANLKFSLTVALDLSEQFYDIFTKIFKSENPFQIIELGLLKVLNRSDKSVKSESPFIYQKPVIEAPKMQSQPVREPEFVDDFYHYQEPTYIKKQTIEPAELPKSKPTIKIDMKAIDKSLEKIDSEPSQNVFKEQSDANLNSGEDLFTPRQIMELSIFKKAQPDYVQFENRYKSICENTKNELSFYLSQLPDKKAKEVIENIAKTTVAAGYSDFVVLECQDEKVLKFFKENLGKAFFKKTIKDFFQKNLYVYPISTNLKKEAIALRKKNRDLEVKNVEHIKNFDNILEHSSNESNSIVQNLFGDDVDFKLEIRK